MIRFNCPNCGREYEVPAALALLPLLCKKCGERIPVPAAPPTPEPRAAPPPRAPVSPPSAPPKPPPAPPTVVAPPPKPAPTPPRPIDDTEDDLPFLIPEPDAPVANSPSGAPLAPASVPAPPVALPARRGPPNRPAAPPRVRKKFRAFVVDAVVVLALLAAGAFLGEMLARKSTREVWQDAGSSVTFPPIDLLMWLAPPALLTLVYALLISRGKSLGARFR